MPGWYEIATMESSPSRPTGPAQTSGAPDAPLETVLHSEAADIPYTGPRALIRRLMGLIHPQRIVGFSKVRIGNPNGDGGYVMVDSFDGIAGALSVGIGGDVSWDLDMANRGIEVFQYDHTVSGPPVSHALFVFLPVGIAETNAPDRSFMSLDQMVADIPGSGDLIAKIDVEGAEWSALFSVSTQTMLRLRQLVIELHEPMSATSTTTIRNLGILKKIAETHTVVHVHANNYAGVRSFDGIHVPDVMEITYFRLKEIQFAPCIDNFPTAMDRPNDPERRDIPMTEILFERYA